MIDENNDEIDNKPISKAMKIKNIIKEAIIYVLIFIVVLYFIPNYVIQKTIVDGPSMENTLENKDHLFVEKLSYRFGNPKRFDIVVFYPYGREDKDDYYVKRVIGLPGETIQIIGSDIYINGEILEENYGKDPITYAGIASEPIKLNDDEYFVLGDNRTVSLDSRYEKVGVVDGDLIDGKVILRIWPLNKFGLLD